MNTNACKLAFGRLPEEILQHLSPLEGHMLQSLEELRERLDRHLDDLKQSARSYEFMDFETAQTLHAECLALLEQMGASPNPSAHRVVQMAVEYFIMDEDAESDVASIIGFDDDAEVVKAARRYLSL